MVTLVVVAIDEGFDMPLQITWQVIVLQKNTVLNGLVPALDIALGLEMRKRIRALDMAVALRPPQEGCIHHADRNTVQTSAKGV